MTRRQITAEIIYQICCLLTQGYFQECFVPRRGTYVLSMTIFNTAIQRLWFGIAGRWYVLQKPSILPMFPNEDMVRKKNQRRFPCNHLSGPIKLVPVLGQPAVLLQLTRLIFRHER